MIFDLPHFYLHCPNGNYICKLTSRITHNLTLHSSKTRMTKLLRCEPYCNGVMSSKICKHNLIAEISYNTYNLHPIPLDTKCEIHMEFMSNGGIDVDFMWILSSVPMESMCRHMLQAMLKG